MNLTMPSTDEIHSGLRHVYTAVGASFATLVTVGVLTQGDATTISTAIHQIGDGIASIAAGIGALVPFVSAAYAMISASRKARLTSLAKDPEIKSIVVASPVVADSIPSSKVTSP